MQLADYLLIILYCFSAWAILFTIYRAYQQQHFSFHLIFSGLYFVTFFLGFPISVGLQFGFSVSLQRAEIVALALLTATAGYFIYFLSYQFFQIVLAKKSIFLVQSEPEKNAKKRAKVTACLLFFIAVLSVSYFIAQNGLLLFTLEKYSQIFSSSVNVVALKRFFYFFLPALLIIYFLYPTRKNWVIFLLLGVGFGFLTYLAVGGTRANMALAVIFFLLIGLLQRYLSLIYVFYFMVLSVVGMFFLAKIRYGLDVQGKEAWFTFLYLTRDTFSPWENLAHILATPIKFQGLMPIVTDFYVYIPKSIWSERPDIVWNTANYFTKLVLGNESGLAISPTLLGSLYLMGGFPFIGFGMVLVGGLLQLTDRLFYVGRCYKSAVIQSYCLGNLFNLVVLVREGVDAFFSRWVFFSVIFILCWGIAFLVTRAINQGIHNE